MTVQLFILSFLLLVAQPIYITSLASADEFKCPPGTKDSGYRPGIIVRWCEVTRDGQLLYHGPVWRWHRNGQLEGKENYVYGNAEGEWPSWYENGTMASLGSLKYGRKAGLWKYWDESGNITTEVTYKEDYNLWAEYYPGGKKKAEGRSNTEGKTGQWTYWDEDGKVKARCDFGEGLFTLPSDACQTIAKELAPEGYSRPTPAGMKTQDGKAVLKLASELYELNVPSGWEADTAAGRKEGSPLVFFPKGGAWRGSGPNIYLRVLFKEDRPFGKVIEDEKEGFQDNVADYQETPQKTGKTQNGMTHITKTISYKPVTPTDSPFSVVSSGTIQETVSFLDVSDRVLLMVVPDVPRCSRNAGSSSPHDHPCFHCPRPACR